MRFIPVEGEVREAERSEYNKTKAELMEFINMNVKTVKVVFGRREYVNIESARNALRSAVTRNNLPIRVRCLGDAIYLIRTDI